MEIDRGAEDRLLNTDETAVKLRVHRDTLKVWRSRGVGPDYIRMPGKIVYRESVLVSYLESCTVTPGATA